MPISFVRSVTETSMMFMMTIAPTINAIPGTMIATRKIVPNIRSRKPVIASGVTIPKLSFSFVLRLRRCSHQNANLFNCIVELIVQFLTLPTK